MDTLSSEDITRLLQSKEKNAILERARSSLAVMSQIEGLEVWSVASPGEFAARLAAIEQGGLSQALADAEFAERSAQGERERAVEALHAATVRALAVARVAWEGVPARVAVLAPLSAKGQARGVIVDEGEEWAAAWEELEPGWVPLEGLTLAAFQALLAAVPTALRAERRVRVRRRVTGAALAVALAELWSLSLRWYQWALAVVPDEKAECLNQIPTTHVPRYAAAKKQRRAERKAAAAASAATPGVS